MKFALALTKSFAVGLVEGIILCSAYLTIVIGMGWR